MTGTQVLLRTPWGGPWRRFGPPDAILEAHQPSDVRGCLDAVDAAVRGGERCAVGFVSYEASAAFGLPVRSTPDGLPLVWFGLYGAAAGEAMSNRALIDAAGIDPSPARLEEARDGVAEAGDRGPTAWRASISHAEYLEGVRLVRARIEAGDTYQINYTWRLTSPFRGNPLALLVALDNAQRGAWSAYVDTGRHVICSASPELFFLVDGGRIECRPMKGTAPRGLWSEDDLERGRRLQTSPKNRAENVMVVDMTRNDLGRLARLGSVEVAALFSAERYPPQWQMTSTVTAAIDEPRLGELFDALFPSGSVTGAPKRSSMGIIGELETGPRGIYTGAIGFVSKHRAHFNVAIRTVHVDRETGVAEFGVGSGIVWDSRDRDEYDECLVKAAILTTRPPAFELLETIGWTSAAGFARLDRHLARLGASAEYFGFAPPDADALRTRLTDAVAAADLPQRVRLLYSRDGRARCDASALAPLPVPLRAALAGRPVEQRDVFLYHKTTNRAVYDEARRLEPAADTVVLWNSRGEVTETTEANLVVEIDGDKVTPPIESGLLPGVLRGELLARHAIVERVVTIPDLRRADGVWAISSLRGWGKLEFGNL